MKNEYAINPNLRKEGRLSDTNKCLIEEILADDNDDIMDLVRASRDIPINLSKRKDDRINNIKEKDEQSHDSY